MNTTSKDPDCIECCNTGTSYMSDDCYGPCMGCNRGAGQLTMDEDTTSEDTNCIEFGDTGTSYMSDDCYGPCMGCNRGGEQLAVAEEVAVACSAVVGAEHVAEVSAVATAATVTFKKEGVKPARHSRKVKRSGMDGITRGDIRRLARQGGVKRINSKVYVDARVGLKDFLTNIIRDTTTYTNYAHRKTVTSNDVCHALKRNGITLYGF